MATKKSNPSPESEAAKNGIYCDICGMFVKIPSIHADEEKEEMLKQIPVIYPLQVTFSIYEDGKVVGRKVM